MIPAADPAETRPGFDIEASTGRHLPLLHKADQVQARCAELGGALARQALLSRPMTPGFFDIVLRLAAAAIAGMILGINRELKDKPAGVRTHAIVALGASIITLLASLPPTDGSSTSRALQGVITGIGFLGAGVILRDEHAGTIRGLTTAGTVWLAASLGAACGLGHWSVAAIAAAIALLILVLGVPIERGIRRYERRDDEHPEPGRRP